MGARRVGGADGSTARYRSRCGWRSRLRGGFRSGGRLFRRQGHRRTFPILGSVLSRQLQGADGGRHRGLLGRQPHLCARAVRHARARADGRSRRGLAGRSAHRKVNRNPSECFGHDRRDRAGAFDRGTDPELSRVCPKRCLVFRYRRCGGRSFGCGFGIRTRFRDDAGAGA